MEGLVIETVLNLLFYCGHRHLTRPFTPLREGGAPRAETYVVCLDCTKQFSYDLKQMRIGKVIDHTHDACVIPPDLSKPRKNRLAYALGVVAVPVAILVGAALKAKKPAVER
jgi:hypothetical protein